MTAFTQLKQADGTLVEFSPAPSAPAKRPSRWSPANWPVTRKVLAIVVVPLILAATFGGLRIYASASAAGDLRLAADRAEMIPYIDDYMAAMEGVLIAATEGGDGQSAMSTFEDRKADLQQRVEATDLPEDVDQAVAGLLGKGQQLVDAVMTDSIDLRQRILDYGPLLLTGEAAITGSVHSNQQSVQAQVEALARAIGARGQMAIQRMLVNRGGDQPEPLLRTSMITMAGTEPSTVAALTKVLGGGSEEAATLRAEMVKRMAMMSNPGIPLVGNPEMLASLDATNNIAGQIIDSTTKAIPAAVEAQANDARNDAFRDAILVATAIISALVIVLLVARSLVRPLRTLRDSALKVAHQDLAKEIERVRAGGELVPVTPIPVQTTEEVGQVAHAVDELHEQAVFLAGEQAQLQLQVSDMFETLSRRSRSLVDQQLSLIDQLERNEDDPERLESLFRLDHLAARMRRNGANLLVLSGSKLAREHSRPVPLATVINAAASEVEDYTRVVTASVADVEITGSAAGDLIHLLAELLDNALRYSPPISQVRVSAVHAAKGALVIEVSDVGLGMTEADLRVANTRLQSGGEVNPYTARHMGLFVVGRLATQHGLVVRLRSTVAEEPSSGTTAGVYIPATLLARDGGDQVDELPYGRPVDAHAGISTALSLDADPADASGFGAGPAEPHLNGAEVPFDLLPQRSPGASGISELPGTLAPEPEPEAEAPVEEPADEPVGEWPQQWPVHTEESAALAKGEAKGAADAAADEEDVDDVEAGRSPTNTSSFFASRGQAATNGINGVNGLNGHSALNGAGDLNGHSGLNGAADLNGATHQPDDDSVEAAAVQADSSDPEGDSIYQSMVSEFEIDPTTHVRSADLDWKTVWEKGWSVAAAAQDAPVEQHTEEGLPMRTPGARLVPGGVAAAVGATAPESNGRHRNGGVHRNDDGFETVASADEPDSGMFAAFKPRDPEAVRTSTSNLFGGVHAGRSHARETRGTDNE
ncbi:HAMP domain-containing sensor histidine kinase [Mycolicibacterium neworleansense]|uniref:histidine kinase n=1 Tax=Mycolicibacterium neworleansense TaxID=146018 RepID=A0A0H5RNV8_9MYCO|nr:sensor histidine kinase [Mycolicibacterium neworleansense]MCV7365033.1 sensor histidine kinase [Mycolicibacterium neworleansense]CRZ15835.1 sensor signal transduction histidine kinase [Mycolicibacterium neworleansense]